MASIAGRAHRQTGTEALGVDSSLGQGRKVTVVGAGFSGLASAYYLIHSGFEVEIVEASDRPGGLISTIDVPEGRVETAANGFLNSAQVEDLFSTVGVPLIGTKREARRRYIYREGRPRQWPLSFRASFAVVKAVFLFIFSKNHIRPKAGESVREWGRRVIGLEATDYTIEAALQGIYAGDPGRMSATLLFGRFFKAKSKTRTEHSMAGNRPYIRIAPDHPRKPLIKGTVSAPEGMGQLIDGLESYLRKRGATFRYGTRYDLSRSLPNHPVVLAGSADQAASLLAVQSPQRARLLAEVELMPIVTATVFFTSTDERSKGFGCLFPPVEKKRVLGVLKNDFIFDDRARRGHSETWILGGAANAIPDVTERTDHEILNIIEKERHACFRVSSEILSYRITRWPKALPHYTLELEEILPRLQGMENNVILIGNYLGQIGLSKLLDRASRLPYEIDESAQWT